MGFFGAIDGFTEMAERLGPIKFQEIFSIYLDEMRQIIMDCSGSVGEFIDADIMAFWNVPLALPEIYVGGLSPDTTTESLKKHFVQYGEIADCIVMMDKATNRSRGFGFVTFRQSEATAAALGARNHLDGKDVNTKKT